MRRPPCPRPDLGGRRGVVALRRGSAEVREERLPGVVAEADHWGGGVLLAVADGGEVGYAVGYLDAIAVGYLDAIT